MSANVNERPASITSENGLELQLRVQFLENEIEDLRRSLANVEEDREAYRKMVEKFLAKEFSEEDKKEIERRIKEEPGGRPFSDVIQELQHYADGKGPIPFSQYIDQLKKRQLHGAATSH